MSTFDAVIVTLGLAVLATTLLFAFGLPKPKRNDRKDKHE